MIELELPNAKAVFTTRAGGVSTGAYASLNVGRLTDDDSAAIEANISQVRVKTGLDELQLLKQVHGREIHFCDETPLHEMPEADAAITRTKRRGLLATGADCPPVALSDGNAVAIVHCGWRPLAAGIIDRIASEFDDGFTAAIGPGICQDHYEVGPEVIEQLGSHAVDNHDGRQLDLKGVIASMLRGAGADEVTDVNRCTSCEPEHFFSHRRDAGTTGRQAGIVWLT